LQLFYRKRCVVRSARAAHQSLAVAERRSTQASWLSRGGSCWRRMASTEGWWTCLI